MQPVRSEIRHGDCLDVLADFDDESFDLVVTSPPYADRRAHAYGGVKPDQYVNWFLPRAAEFHRVLKRTGSFVLNIKEKADAGERHTFVLELILALRKNGWLWTEEYIWHKKNCHPGKWPNRFRDAWERCLHFTRERRFKMNQEAVMIPMGDWKEKRLRSLGSNDIVRFNSQVGSGFGKNIANWKDRDLAYPSNVLHLATECGNKSHSAAFPKTLPAWFIKLFTDPGDWVLDPFAGSGTACVAAQELGRKCVGIDMKSEFSALASRELKEAALSLFEKPANHGTRTRKAS